MSKKSTKIDCVQTVREYIDKTDWRISANANTDYSHPGLVNNVAGKVIANFWLDDVYSEEEGQAHRTGDFHIHDLDILAPYCFTGDTEVMLGDGTTATFFELIKRTSGMLGKRLFVPSYNFDRHDILMDEAYDVRCTRKKAVVVKVYFNKGKPVRCTPDHKFLLEDETWKPARFLTPNDKLLGIDPHLKVVRVENCDELEDVYCMTVRENHNFQLANGTVVHNCCGHDLQKLLDEGFNGVVGRVGSKPPKHLNEALYQMANYLGILQAEWAGAQAFSSFDTYLAPYVFFDRVTEGLNESGLRRAMTSFVYNLNVPSRWGQCVPVSYKAMRPDGTWASFDELKVGDEILTYNMETGKLENKPLTHVNLYDAPEKMHQYQSEDGKNTFIVTPNHRVIIEGDSGYLEMVESEKLFAKGEVRIPTAWHFNFRKECVLWNCKTYKITEVAPTTDKVWCPTTENGTFICLSDEGSAFLTGNSPFTNVTIDWRVPQMMQNMLPTRGGDNFFLSIQKEREEAMEKITGQKQTMRSFSTWAALRDACIDRYEKVTGETYEGEKDDIFLYMTYSMFQEEMDMINAAFYEVLNKGDLKQMPFTFPIPTINITEDFDWHGKNTEILFENTAKYGSSYFQNFIGSQYKRDENGNLVRDENAYSPNDVRSMCCRLQLDKTQLRKRGGGLFGSDSQTGCYDEKTEVLTDEGWKKFADLTLGDKLYTLNEDGAIEIHKPDALFAYDYEGELYHFKSRRMDLMVTPNHRMLGLRKNGNHFFVEAQDTKNLNVPIVGSWKTSMYNDKLTLWVGDKQIDVHTWMSFLGLFLTEGNAYINKKNSTYRVSITQNKGEKANFIRTIFKKLPFKYSEYEYKGHIRFVINNKAFAYGLANFGDTFEKYIPQYVWNFGKNELQSLYRGLMLGDGCYTQRHGKTTFSTSSPRLRDDFQRLLLLLGLHGDVLTFNRAGKSEEYQINVSKGTQKTISPDMVTKVPYKGRVYCAQVENHTLFVRRNGKTCWCGNSIGVVTINMARLGYKHKGDMPALLENLDKLMDMGKSTLEKKRVFVKDMFDRGLYPFTRRYIRTFDTYFSTIGVNGMNEMVRNFTNDEFDITDERGQKMCLDILTHIRERLIRYQEETGNLYNLEATPAEGTMRRFSHLDKKMFPDILQAGNGQTPYYTNSSQLPVDFTADAFTALDLQDDLQKQYTGGCVEAGVKVFTSKGFMKIEDIVKNFAELRQGEKPFCVMSFNEKTLDVEWDEVIDAMAIDVSQHDKVRVCFDGWEIVTSDWHPFYVVTKGDETTEFKDIEFTTKRADELQPGDRILGNDFGHVIQRVTKTDVEDNQFYDLTTKNNHNYCCGRSEEQMVFIHNTVLHVYMRERLSTPDACRRLVKTILSNYRLPYISITPTFSICPIHGRLEGEQEFCPYCDQEIIKQHAEEVDPNL